MALIGPVTVGNRLHNFHTNWVLATRWCCSRGQEINITNFENSTTIKYEAWPTSELCLGQQLI